MFGFLKGNTNYEKIFSSRSETQRFLYNDRTKTSEILGDQKFINSWLDSKHVGDVTAVIKGEALRGDIPSLKQMIWVCDLYYEDAPNQYSSPGELLKARTVCLQERISYCQKAIEKGLSDQSYYAMTSSAKLYNLYANASGALENPIVQRALLGIIVFAEMFLETDIAEIALRQDAENAITHYSPMANVVAQMIS